jgi:hypothetical protein
LGWGRNSLLTEGTANVDMGVIKTVHFGETHLDVIAQFFNLLNHVNAVAINPFFGSGVAPIAGFRRPIRGVSARQIQLALNFEY